MAPSALLAVTAAAVLAHAGAQQTPRPGVGNLVGQVSLTTSDGTELIKPEDPLAAGVKYEMNVLGASAFPLTFNVSAPSPNTAYNCSMVATASKMSTLTTMGVDEPNQAAVFAEGNDTVAEYSFSSTDCISGFVIDHLPGGYYALGVFANDTGLLASSEYRHAVFKVDHFAPEVHSVTLNIGSDATTGRPEVTVGSGAVVDRTAVEEMYIRWKTVDAYAVGVGTGDNFTAGYTTTHRITGSPVMTDEDLLSGDDGSLPGYWCAYDNETEFQCPIAHLFTDNTQTTVYTEGILAQMDIRDITPDGGLPSVGAHTITIYAEDVAGNIESHPTVFSFYMIEGMSARDAAFEYEVTNGTHVQTGAVAMGDSEWDSYAAAAFDMHSPTPTTYTFKVWAIDSAGLKSVNYSSFSWEVDQTGPTCSYVAGEIGSFAATTDDFVTPTYTKYPACTEVVLTVEMSEDDCTLDVMLDGEAGAAGVTTDPGEDRLATLTFGRPLVNDTGNARATPGALGLGEHTASSTPRDILGNKGAACMDTWTTAEISTTAAVVPGNGACVNTNNFTITPEPERCPGDAAIAGYYEYKMPGDTHFARGYDASFTANSLPEGKTTIMIRATENGTYVSDDTPLELEVCVDTIPPQILSATSSDVAAGGTTSAGSVTVKVAADADTVSVQVTGNATATLDYDGSVDEVDVIATNEGEYSVNFRATDAAGNVGDRFTFLFSVDRGDPNTVIAMGPVSPSPEGDLEFTVMAVGELGDQEEGSTFSYRLDGGAASPFVASPFTVTATAGVHTLEVVARDGATNLDKTPALYTFTVLGDERTDGHRVKGMSYSDFVDAFSWEVVGDMPSAKVAKGVDHVHIA